MRSDHIKRKNQQALRRKFAANALKNGIGSFFSMMDANGNGKISRKEFQRGLEKLGMGVILSDEEQVDSLFAAIDTDRNSILDLDEVTEFVGMMAKGSDTVAMHRQAPPSIRLRPANYAEMRAESVRNKNSTRQRKLPFSMGTMALPLVVPRPTSRRIATSPLVAPRPTSRSIYSIPSTPHGLTQQRAAVTPVVNRLCSLPDMRDAGPAS